MSAILDQISCSTNISCPVERDIRSNSAWLGDISGLKADKLLRNRKTPYLYVLREGEHKGDYYVSFVTQNLTVFHQPFNIATTETGWYYENTGGGPLSTESCLDDILFSIMHCEKGQCQPLDI